MATTVDHMPVESVIRTLESGARSRDIPAAVIECAGLATRRAFAGQRPRGGLERRMEAYFASVVRRRLVRSEGGERAAARVVAAALVADMERSGRDPNAIWTELDRGWRNSIPEDLLEEYRARLCA